MTTLREHLALDGERIMGVELDEARSLLGVSPTDEWDAVRVAYRKLIRQQHPDHAGPGATIRAAQLNDAYRVLSRALQVQTAAGTRPRRRLAEPPTPRFDAHIEGADTLVVEAPLADAFSQLLEAGHVVGHVSYVDRSSAIFEVVVKHEGETCSFVVSLEGEDKTEAYCTLESMERAQRLSPTPIVRQLAAALRTPWVSPLFGPEDEPAPDQAPPGEAVDEDGPPADPTADGAPGGSGGGSGNGPAGHGHNGHGSTHPGTNGSPRSHTAAATDRDTPSEGVKRFT